MPGITPAIKKLAYGLRRHRARLFAALELTTHCVWRPSINDLATIQAALNRPPSPYDSHPFLADRFSFVRALPRFCTCSSTDYVAEACLLLSERVAIEVETTGVARNNLQAQSAVEMPAVVER